MAQNHPAYDSALATGKVVVRRFWKNQNSTKNQLSVQFQQEIEREPTEVGSDNFLVGLAQAGAIGNKTRPTAIFSFEATRAAQILGSEEGSCFDGSTAVVYADQFFAKLAEASGQKFEETLGIQITENFEKNPYSESQQPKVNPTTGEIIMAVNPATGTEMPVYRHTKLALQSQVQHTYVVREREAAPAAPMIAPFTVASAGEITS